MRVKLFQYANFTFFYWLWFMNILLEYIYLKILHAHSVVLRNELTQ